MMFFVYNYPFYRTDCFPERKSIFHNHVGLLRLVSIEASVCISLGHACNDADVISLLSFTNKSLLAGDLNAKYPFWKNVVFNFLGAKLLNLLHINEFEISALHCVGHYSRAGDGDVLHMVMHKNIRLSEVIVSDILDSGHLLVVFHLLDYVKTTYLSDPVDKLIDWERFQSLASEIILPRIQINSREEANKAARNFYCLYSFGVQDVDKQNYTLGPK
jgi:hypothetical protein